MTGARLAGKVAAITGAGSGIGRATALRFASEGARVVVNDIDEATATATAAAAGGLAVPGDVGDRDVLEELVALAVRSYGRLDVLHNNAGYGVPDRVADLSGAQLTEMLRVNLLGVLHGTQAALPVMIDQGGGSIVNTASNAGLAAAPGRTAYGLAKAAVIQITRSTAVEHGRHGIRANALCPGPILTPAFERFAPDLDFYAAQIPMKRLGSPDDVAALALFLASDEAAYVSGAVIPIDGAMSARLSAPFLSAADMVE